MKVYKVLIIIFLFIPGQVLFTQPDTLWTKIYNGTYTDYGIFVQQTSDGGYIITGHTTPNFGGSTDAWLIKTDSSGDTLWTRKFGGSDTDWSECVRQTDDEGFIITGFTYSHGVGLSDLWLIKTDPAGDTLWTKTYGGTNRDYGHSVQQTTDGGYIITGDTESYGSGDFDLWLIKTNSSGDTLWTRTFGGSDYERGSSVQQTSDGGYIISGETASFGAGNVDVYLIKTDQWGDTLWTRTFGGIYKDTGRDVHQTPDGGYFIAATYGLESPSDSDVCLIKTDANGDTLWTHIYGGEGREYGASGLPTLDGGYIVGGSSITIIGISGFADIFYVKTDHNGDLLWTFTCGGEGQELAYDIQQTTDGGYIIIGMIMSQSTMGEDVYLIKIAGPTIVHDEIGPTVPQKCLLYENYPNPFNPITTIDFELPKSGEVILKIYNILGEEVATLVSDRLSTGLYSYEWDASGYASGIYLYRLQAGDYVETRKMVLMR